jgi:ligand-binding sensor domain-containing protein/serine phosphatase RsbU (regulator of sigma subunit)
MKYMLKSKILITAALCLTIFSQVSNGQTYSFRNYGAENNIPNGFVYTIQQSDDGYLWIGTGSGVARFDGFSFYPVPYPDSTVMRYPTACIRDGRGALWFGCNDGSLFFTRENKLVQVKLENEKSISAIIAGPKGRIYVIPQGGAVFSVDTENGNVVRRFGFSEEQVMSSAAIAGSDRLLIGTQDKLLICSLATDTLTIETEVDGFDNNAVTAILCAGDSTDFVAGTEGNGLFRIRLTGKQYTLSKYSNQPELRSLSVQSMILDSEKNLWVATFGSGVFEFSTETGKGKPGTVRTYNITSGLVTDDIKRVFQDTEGNFWFGTYYKGLSMLTSYAFGYYTPGNSPERNNIIYVNAYKDKFLLGTPVGFHLYDAESGKSLSFTDLKKQTGNQDIASYLLDKDGNLWIGTTGSGLYVRDNAGSVRRFFRSGDSGTDYIKDIELNGNNLWLATLNGVVLIDPNTSAEKKRFDISNGLPHNSINKIMPGSDGSVYIGTECDRLYSIGKDLAIKQGNIIMSGNTINKVFSFAQCPDGSIWAATNSNGLFRFRNDSLLALNRSNTMMSNYCYGILADSEGNIWIGHEKGFSKYNSARGTLRVFGSDLVKAGVCNPDAMFESDSKKIFIGTTDGLIVYDINKARTAESVPHTNINYISINDVKYPYRKSFTLPYSRKNVFRINFVGINYSDPGKVYYSTYLENYDNEWSKLSTEKEVSYNLRDGKYRFRVISVNEEGISQDQEISFDILIRHPFWRTWWFFVLLLVAASGIVMIVIREREKAHRKVQDYLERELDARTAVVLQQKGEIELQNIEITDSINYAKRIQSSILPDITKLKESFRDAFILFHPRDIVSGDFYWFDRLDDDRFLLVCADSTGHGVPGAFMSMIGSTLLQDIVTRKRITKPSEVLSLLDKQIFSTLNQNVEMGASNDGMDMVVCEFNTATRHLRFASAMRPVILFMGKESFYIKGNRSSIGGESVSEKYFDDQEYYLNPNDALYLFSDGLSDQFGGPDGKKMKIARLRSLIEEIVELPMEEQKVIIEKFYAEWKGAYEQVDDILLMGVKV